MSNHSFETELAFIISEVRYVTGVHKTLQLLGKSIEPAKLNALTETINSQVNKSILSTALKFRRLTTKTTDSYFSKDTAKMVIDLFIHASRIPLTDQTSLENTCKGICNLLVSFPMYTKPKKVAKVKGDDSEKPSESINDSDDEDGDKNMQFTE
jgi:hypothetical protein